MRVIICGAGRVGYGIAERLVSEQHDVTVIDSDPKLISSMRNNLDIRGIVGHGAHPDVLAAAGADEADMLIAVTLYDEVNMIACQVAHSLFNVPMKIARIRARSYLTSSYQTLFYRDNLPINVVISPEMEVSEMILRRIILRGALDVLYLADEQVVFLTLECVEDCPVLNTPLRQLSELFPDLNTTVVAVKRGDKIFTTHSDTELFSGDIVYLTTTVDQVRRALGLFGHEDQNAKFIIIAGGGNIGFYVARAIEKRGHRVKVKIIELEEERAHNIADELTKTTILRGSALDVAVLEEANISKADLFISLTNQDQVNILSAIMAKGLGCKTNMVLLNKLIYEEFSKTVGIDAILNPRSVTISKILQQMRRGRIRSVYSVANGKAEIIEAEAMPTSPLIGLPLGELALPEGLRIGAIYRDKEVIMPNSGTKIIAGDRIILFALAENVKDAEYFFRVSLEYF